MRSVNGNVPACGLTSNNIFGFGRGRVNGDTTVGKIASPVGAMFASYRSAEHRLESYDALASSKC